jgi:simple sugar transport system ATP-binding protein
MVGATPPQLAESKAPHGSEIALRADEIRVADAGNGVSLEVRRGEILGIGGVDGNGQLELAEALAGVAPIASGSLRVAGDVAYIPQDRRRDGLAPHLSILENLMISGHVRQELRTLGLLNPQAARRWAIAAAIRFDVRMSSLDAPAASLSGGNQQKLVLARVLSDEPELIVAMNPTRGLDVRAAAFVHDALIAAKSRGAAVVLFSTDLDELGALADRTLFMSAGRCVQGASVGESMGGVG